MLSPPTKKCTLSLTCFSHTYAVPSDRQSAWRIIRSLVVGYIEEKDAEEPAAATEDQKEDEEGEEKDGRSCSFWRKPRTSRGAQDGNGGQPVVSGRRQSGKSRIRCNMYILQSHDCVSDNESTAHVLDPWSIGVYVKAWSSQPIIVN